MIDRATIAETAVAAAGGGRVVRLSRDRADGSIWNAVVAGPHRRRRVELDLLLGAARVSPARRPASRRRGSPGCRMGGCPPRTRRLA